MRLKGFPPLITLLLMSSLILTIGRAITLPFITIYMTEHFHLEPESVGLVLGVSLALGITASFYGGYLVDKFDKHRLMIISIALFTLTFCIMPWLNDVLWMVPVLALLHAAYSIFSIAIKACFAEWLPVSERIRGFSMNYTLVNVGWAAGPALGVFAASFYPMLPFFLSGLLAFLVGLTLWLRLDSYGLPPANGDTVFTDQRLTFSATFKVLSHDRRLIFYAWQHHGRSGCRTVHRLLIPVFNHRQQRAVCLSGDWLSDDDKRNRRHRLAVFAQPQHE